jgi:pyruvate/2-oxoacid:ferredoxin oxidoreductase beta subunit
VWVVSPRSKNGCAVIGTSGVATAHDVARVDPTVVVVAHGGVYPVAVGVDRDNDDDLPRPRPLDVEADVDGLQDDREVLVLWGDPGGVAKRDGH